MIKNPEDFTVLNNRAMLGGPGEVLVHRFATNEELLHHARLFGILELRSGCGIGYHTHTDETEFFYVLKGTPTLCDNGTEVLLHPGQVAQTPSGCGHSVTNNTDETVELLALIMQA